jgi:hypothetical protein
VVAAAVLVPFAVLVALALFPGERAEPKVEPLRLVLNAPTPPVPPARPVVDAGLAPSPFNLPPPRVEPEAREDLRALVATTRPRVRRCLQDEEPRGTYELRVRFTEAGVRADTQNPFLAACVEDVFDEVGFHPDAGFSPAEHTFSFEGPAE